MKQLVLIILGGCFTIVFKVSFAQNKLKMKSVLSDEIRMSIPSDFINIPKAKYVPAYTGDPKPDDFYCNKDTSIEISFLKTPRRFNDLKWCKTFTQSAFLNRAHNVYFNDTISINGSLIFLAEFESAFKGHDSYCKVLIVNSKKSTVIISLLSQIQHKKYWKTESAKIIESIRIN